MLEMVIILAAAVGGSRALLAAATWLEHRSSRREPQLPATMYGPGWQPFEGWSPPSISLLVEEDERERAALRQHRVFRDGCFVFEDHWPSCAKAFYRGCAGWGSAEALGDCPRAVRLDETSDEARDWIRSEMKLSGRW